MKQENNSGINVNELTQKIEKMEETLKKDIFSNPVRQVQEHMREELVDFSNIFHRNLRDLECYIVNIYIKFFTFKNKLENSQASENKVISPGAPVEEETVPKRLLDKKEYQCEIIKQAFSDYEKKTVNFNY